MKTETPMAYGNILEEEIKNKVAKEYFGEFDCTRIIGKIDFCITVKTELHLAETQSIVWGEAKKGQADIYNSLVQLILTVGKARTFDAHLPPAYLCAFDAEKIAFVPYNEVSDIFYQNDFNWNVAPSNHETREFKQVYNRVKHILDQKFLVFFYEKDDTDLRLFIKENFVVGKMGVTKLRIDKNNFITIYNKWLNAVKPTIAVNWDKVKKIGIIDGDFYLADLLSKENETLKEKLFVLLRANQYVFDRRIDEFELFSESKTTFLDKQIAHTQFWNKYERPPAIEYWDYIVDRRDLLVPQDIRERKGSFYTPQIWVELSQKYLADVLGEDWQDEYYVWDCAAGTGNLLAGLSNKYRIWASTIDKQDVDVMKDRINNGANLLEDHVFQFDFLNDDFSKLPPSLKKIIEDDEKRKKLIVYINPPYVEGDARIGKGRRNVHESKIHDKYQNELKRASGELFAQFFVRIYMEIQGCILAEFSTLKVIQAPNFSDFRLFFKPKLEKLLIIPANTFDNVKGQFPIGFFIWNTSKNVKFESAVADVYNAKGVYSGTKNIYCFDGSKYISDWLETYSKNIATDYIGNLASVGNDFQNQNTIFIENITKIRKKGGRHTLISFGNLKIVAIFFAVRRCIKAMWLNDRDQFLYPNDGWQTDREFQNDCLAFTLFSNNIQSAYGVNHWIPFTENEVNARDIFDSNFMTKFIQGKLKPTTNGDLIHGNGHRTTPLEFSPEALAVFDAGRELWKYYHAKPNVNVNASLYDIREYFQGRNENGKMNSKSDDEQYTFLIGELREKLKMLAKKIEPKVYEYGFLKI